MSMISAQRDRLRAISQVLGAQGYVVEADEVRDAADMLWKLRCDLVDLNAKYDELREHAHMIAKSHETCHIVDDHGDCWWECDECGATIDWDGADAPSCNYCPNCGRRVVKR